MKRFLFLFLLSISEIPIFVNIKKYKKNLKNGPCHRIGQGINFSHQQTFSIATYRPPATTISFYSTSSSPEKENVSSNRLGTPLAGGGGGGGVEKPEGPSALQPTTENREVLAVGINRLLV